MAEWLGRFILFTLILNGAKLLPRFFFTISGKNEIATKTSRTRTIGRFTQGKSYDRSVILVSLVQ